MRLLQSPHQLNKGDDKMEQILTTILAWFNPINVSILLVSLGVFLWLLSRAEGYNSRK
jgi:hypothetical protein